MILYTTRHGQTDNNLKGIIQGIIDTPLNETGIEEAEELKNKLKDINFDLVISSPLKRAMDTAKIIIGSKNIPIIIDDRIVERNAGDFEGKSHLGYDHIKAWNYKLNSDLDANVERVQDIFKRVNIFLNDIKEKYSNKTILIVAHEAVLRALHYSIIGFNEDDDLKSLKIDNCCLFKYEI